MKGKASTGNKGYRRPMRPTKESERRKMQEAYHTLVDNALEGFAILQNARIVFCNQALAQMSGYSKEELLRLSPHEVEGIVHADDRVRVVEVADARLKEESRPPQQRFRFVDRLGGVRWLETKRVRTEFGGAPALQVSYVDITERVNAENALRASEKELRSFIDKNIIGVVLVDENQRIAEWNHAMEEITGMLGPTVIGQSTTALCGLVPEKDNGLDEMMRLLASRSGERLSEAAIMQVPQTIAGTIRSADGVLKTLKLSIFPIHTAQGIKAAGMVEDLSVQRQAIEAYRILVDNSLEGFAIIQDGHIAFCNEALTKMSGYSRSETLTMTPEEIATTVHPEDRPLVARAMREILESEKSFPTQPIRLIDRMGRERWVEVRAARTIYNFRPALQLSYLDISERYETERMLRKSEGRFRTLIETAPMAIGISREGRMVYGNHAYFRMFGIEGNEEIADKLVSEQIAPQDREEVLARAQRRSSDKAAESKFEMMGMRRDGSQFSCAVEVIVVDLSDGPATVAFISDLTSSKETEGKLRDSQTRLRNLATHLLSAREDERKRTAREVHDELGQVLTAMKIDLKWVEKRLEPTLSQVRDKIREVVGLADQTIRTVQRISSQLRPGVLDDLGLAAAIEWLGADFSRRNGITCSVRVEISEPRIDGNSATALFRVIQETLTNIARHAGASRASVELIESEGSLQISVCDNGVGITQKQIGAHSSLGLIGIRERVEGLGGMMSISGEVGAGTTISITIPLQSKGRA